MLDTVKLTANWPCSGCEEGGRRASEGSEQWSLSQSSRLR